MNPNLFKSYGLNYKGASVAHIIEASKLTIFLFKNKDLSMILYRNMHAGTLNDRK